MSGSASCQSCSMSIESGTLCQYCSDRDGNLLAFEECFDRFVQFARKRDPELDLEEARERTRTFMRGMPAWADHPALEPGEGR